MSDDFSVVLNSTQSFAGTVNNNRTYLFDWTDYALGRYKCSFTYKGGDNNLTGSSMPLVYMDLGGNPQMYTTSATQSGNQTSLFLGTLDGVEIASATQNYYLKADTTSNPPVVMNRPQSQQLNVRIVQNDTTTAWVDAAAAANTNYILTLHFEKC